MKNRGPGLIPWDELDISFKKPRDIDGLTSRWIAPPFSVLDSRQGYWQKRKRLWLNLGIKSELGRGETLTYRVDPDGCSTSDPSKTWTDRGKRKLRKIDASPGGSPMPACDYSKRQRGDGRGRPLARTFGQDLMRGENKKFAQGQGKINRLYKRDGDAGGVESQSGTSIFDPVICECVYQWFCPSGGRILDPFAGGSVRGIVASVTGRNYTGVDLSERQVTANFKQGQDICSEPMPEWIVGDSGDVQTLCDGEYDLIFSCPPYSSLERYSNDPQDLSTMTWDEFLTSYRTIIKQSCAMLRDNRFTIFVVSQIRDKKTGAILDLVGETVRAFEAAGLNFYNDIVYLNAIGSAPIRAHKQLKTGRKVVRTHQNILVFCKGSWRRAVAELSNERIRGSYV